VLSFKEKRNILHTIKGRKANYSGHMLSSTYCLKHVIDVKIEGRIEVAVRGGRRRRQT
jgi:hypothetical protein